MSREGQGAGAAAYLGHLEPLTLIDVTVNPDDPLPPYAQVAEALRTAIRSGLYAPGDRLPSVKNLAVEHGVAQMTVHRALRTIRDEGYVDTLHGRGTFVRSELPEGGPRVANYEAVSQRIDDLCETIEDLNQRVERLETQGQSPGRKVGEPARSQRRGAPKR